MPLQPANLMASGYIVPSRFVRADASSTPVGAGGVTSQPGFKCTQAKAGDVTIGVSQVGTNYPPVNDPAISILPVAAIPGQQVQIFGQGSSDILLEMAATCNEGDFLCPTGTDREHHAQHARSAERSQRRPRNADRQERNHDRTSMVRRPCPTTLHGGRREDPRGSHGRLLHLPLLINPNTNHNPGRRRAAKTQGFEPSNPDSYERKPSWLIPPPPPLIRVKANVFIRDHAASGKLVVDFARTPAISP